MSLNKYGGTRCGGEFGPMTQLRQSGYFIERSTPSLGKIGGFKFIWKIQLPCNLYKITRPQFSPRMESTTLSECFSSHYNTHRATSMGFRIAKYNLRLQCSRFHSSRWRMFWLEHSTLLHWVSWELSDNWFLPTIFVAYISKSSSSHLVFPNPIRHGQGM